MIELDGQAFKVTDRELRLIVHVGYLLGAGIGTVLVVVYELVP